MSEQTTDQFDPADGTVDDVNTHLADADEAERTRVLQAERDGKARVGVLEGPHAGDTTGDSTTPALNTKGATFTDAAKAANPDPVGYAGVSPEAERTGRADKGLSQQNPNVLNGGPLPDARPGVDDTEGLNALTEDA